MMDDKRLCLLIDLLIVIAVCFFAYELYQFGDAIVSLIVYYMGYCDEF